MREKIKVIIFDLGQTLVEYDLSKFYVYIKERFGYNKKSPEEVVKIVFESQAYRSYERGGCSTSEYYQEIIKSLEIKNLSLVDFENAFCCIFSPNKGIDELLENLSHNYKLFFISNLSKVHWEKALSTNTFIKKHFNNKQQQILSYKEGSQKPEEDIYFKALENAHVLPSEAIFLDDKEENVLGFRRIGGSAEVYNCSKQSVEDLRELLKKHQIACDN